VTVLVDRLDRADRERLLERLAELPRLDYLMREPSRQRPPAPPLPPGVGSDRSVLR
jgi:hypothetical protein